MVLTVIFGAGASYDSDPSRPGNGAVYPNQPPLASSLFDRRSEFISALRSYPECTAVVDALRLAVELGANLEAQLANLETNGESNPRRASQLMAIRYYLREIIDESAMAWNREIAGVTNYVRLADRLSDWSHSAGKEVNYVTFNYDTLLETALIANGMEFTNIMSYVSGNGAYSPKVFKPHGSCDWQRVVTYPLSLGAELSVKMVIEHAASLTYEDSYVLRRPGVGELSATHSGQTFVPAIAVPTNDKREYVFPTQHVPMLRKALHGTDVILVIGWRGTDGTFANELKERIQPGRHVVLVNGTSESNAFTQSELTRRGINQVHYHHFDEGFTDLARGESLQEVLRTVESFH